MRWLASRSEGFMVLGREVGRRDGQTTALWQDFRGVVTPAEAVRTRDSAGAETPGERERRVLPGGEAGVRAAARDLRRVRTGPRQPSRGEMTGKRAERREREHRRRPDPIHQPAGERRQQQAEPEEAVEQPD